MNIRKRLWTCLLVSGIPFSACLPAAAAVFTVTESFWGDATTTNSFAWALNQANTTPGDDIINLQLTSGNTIDVDAATPVSSSFLGRITDSVEIQGNGVTLVGTPRFVATNGTIYTKTLIPAANPSIAAGDVVVQPAFSFAEILPTAITVAIDKLNLDGLNGYLSGGIFMSVHNSLIKNSVSYGFGARPVFEALASALELKNVILDSINPLANNQLGSAWFGAIQGVNATLQMTNSVIKGASTSVGAILWKGSADVVSSIITGDAGGLSIEGPGSVLNFVNSLFSPSEISSTARIQAKDGGVANLTASTIQANQLFINTELDCATSPSWYGCNGSPLQAYDGGQINLSQSIVSTINADLNGILNPYSETYLAFPAGNLTADLLSYVQPTPSLDPTALQALFNQPGLLTGTIPYALTNGGLLYGDLPEGAYLVPGSPLRRAIADADGANQLRSPIDNSVIRTDVFGNPRTAFGTRDIGAVQSPAEVPGPLPALGLAAAFRWFRRLRRTVRAGRR